MFDAATQWLHDLNLEPSTKVAIALAAIVAIAILTHFILHYVFLRLVEKLTYRSKWVWKRALFEQNLFNRIAFVFQAVLVRWQAQLWLAQESLFLSGIELAAKLWILFYLLLSLFSLLGTLALLGSSIPRRKTSAFARRLSKHQADCIRFFLYLIRFDHRRQIAGDFAQQHRRDDGGLALGV